MIKSRCKKSRQIQKGDLIDLLSLEGLTKSEFSALSLLKEYPLLYETSYMIEGVGFIIAEKTLSFMYVHYLFVTPSMRNKNYARSLIGVIKDYGLPILLYHNKALSEFYSKNEFIIGTEVLVSLYNPNNEVES